MDSFKEGDMVVFRTEPFSLTMKKYIVTEINGNEVTISHSGEKQTVKVYELRLYNEMELCLENAMYKEFGRKAQEWMSSCRKNDPSIVEEEDNG